MSLDSKTKTISLLKTNTLVDLTAAAETILYTSDGHRGVVTHVVVRDPSISLAGVTAVVFGCNAGTRNDWDASSRTLALVTGATLSQVLTPTLPGDSADQVSTVIPANGTFGIKITTNSGAAATATIDVFGYLFT